MIASEIAKTRRELRLAVCEIEAACWALEMLARLPSEVVDSTDAAQMVKRAVLAANQHLERAKS